MLLTSAPTMLHGWLAARFLISVLGPASKSWPPPPTLPYPTLPTTVGFFKLHYDSYPRLSRLTRLAQFGDTYLRDRASGILGPRRALDLLGGVGGRGFQNDAWPRGQASTHVRSILVAFPIIGLVRLLCRRSQLQRKGRRRVSPIIIWGRTATQGTIEQTSSLQLTCPSRAWPGFIASRDDGFALVPSPRPHREVQVLVRVETSGWTFT